MSSPMRQARRRSQANEEEVRQMNGAGASNAPIATPMANSRLAASRIAHTQPTYDFISGASGVPPTQPSQHSLNQSQAAKPDIGNEDLRAKVKTLQYELESFKQERELATLRHEKDLREVQFKAEADFKRLQASESDKHITAHKCEALSQELKETQDQATNQLHDLEKNLRALQEENRSLKEDVEEGQTELSSVDRQYKHQLQEVDSKHATLQKTLSDLRGDLETKSTAFRTTQDRLSQRETEVGRLESEVLRLKAQTGDAETLGVIKRELSEQVVHIRKLEATNREQNTELRHFRRIHKAVEVVEEEKRMLERRVNMMEDLRNELREAQLQRQILEDERQSWTSYLQDEGGNGGRVEFDSPESLARALVQERLETASLVERLGVIQPELSEKDDIIKSLEDEQTKIQTEIEKLRASGGGGDSRTKTRLERQRALAVKEVEYLREQLRTFDSEETTYQPENRFDEQKTKRIQDLESIVDQYRTETRTLAEELSNCEGDPNTAPDSQTLKRPRDDEPDEHLGQLSRKNRKLQDTLASLQHSHALIQSDLSATKTQLSCLQESSKTRILSLRSNPTSDAEALKLSTLTSLREENKALLARLESSSNGFSHNLPAKTEQLIPISTLHNARAELRDLAAVVASKEKMTLRLKETFSRKANEFREAVASLLGWQMNFMPNGRVRMTSIFYPSNDEDEDDGGIGNSLVFDGETGSMQISGGPKSEFGREIRGLIRFWVDERKEIPGFLAAATLEFYDKSTKAARA